MKKIIVLTSLVLLIILIVYVIIISGQARMADGVLEINEAHIIEIIFIIFTVTLAIVVWLLGIVVAVRNSRWGWLISILFFVPLSYIYLLISKDALCIKKPSQSSKSFTAPSISQKQAVYEETTNKTMRGGVLTTYLIIMSGFAVLNIILVLLGKSLSTFSCLNQPKWLVETMSFASLIFCFGVWKMKKWGVYGLSFLILVGIIVNVIMGFSTKGIVGHVSQLIGAVIFIFVIYGPFKRMS